MKSGRWALALLLAAGLLGIALDGGRLFERLFWSGALIGLVSWAWPRLVIGHLQVQRTPYSLQAGVGDLFREQFRIRYTGRLPVPWLEVADETPWPDRALQQRPSSRVITLLKGGQQRVYLARTWLVRRGVFPLGPTRLTVRDPFGLFPVSRTFPPTAWLQVLPFVMPLQLPPVGRGGQAGGAVTRRKSVGITPYAAGVRPYQPGDPLRRIHWPATAHRGTWMVREFEDDRQPVWWLFLDAFAPVQVRAETDAPLPRMGRWWFYRRPEILLPQDTLEYAVSLTASLLHHLTARGQAVGLAVSGGAPQILPAERGERHLYQALKLLAHVRAGETVSLGALLAAQAARAPRGGAALVVTPDTRPELLLGVEHLLRRGVRPLVILLDGASFGGTETASAAAQRLRNRGAAVVLLHYGDDPSDTLRQGLVSWPHKELLWTKPGFTPST